MNLLSDIITYVRRLIKSPSNALITDALIIDYINRFWLMDVDARMQLFDLKTKYQFETTPGVADYNMPIYNPQTETNGQTIASFPIYQGFGQTVYANGIQIPFYTQRESFWNLWPNYVQALPESAVGNGTAGPYQLSLPFFPAIPGHVDMTGLIATGTNIDPPFVNSATGTSFISAIPATSVYTGIYIVATNQYGQNITITDSGLFLSGNNGGDLYGLLMVPGNSTTVGNTPLSGTYTTTNNTVNYNTGVVNVTFPASIPAGTPIQAQCYFYQPGIPRALLYYNNILTIRPPPDTQYLIEVDAYLTPAAFLSSTGAIPFAYMAEYLSRGAARKLLADTGDIEQFQFYEPLFKEQELLVWKRSQRQFTSTRTSTIFSETQGQTNYNNIGQGTN
jgi:hypothetical protein